MFLPRSFHLMNVMACKQVLVIWGATYPNRLWRCSGLLSLVAFMSFDQAAKDHQRMASGSWPMNAMACRQVLVIWGALCLNR